MERAEDAEAPEERGAWGKGMGRSRGAAKNTSSMLYDVLHARPTEVDFINGHICRLGKQYSVATPTTKTLWDLMQLRAAIPLDLIV